jgi:transposase
VGLKVGFSRRAAMQSAVGVDEGQVLTLRVGEACGHGWHLRAGRDLLLRQEVSMHVRYRVELGEGERQELEALVAGGTRGVRRVKRGQILLAAAAGQTDETIAVTVQVGTSTVYRTKRRFVEEGLGAALAEDARPGGARKLTSTEEALLIATACSTPPEGRSTWTLALLADALVALTPHTRISRQTIGRRLQENDLKPWQRKMWCVPRVDAQFVARMEDVLELYTAEPAAGTAVVCVDETPRQLVAEVRDPSAPRPGRAARRDYEYRRNGTANVFVALDAHRPWRMTKVTERRTAQDFAVWLRELVDVHYATTDRIHVVLDNLSTHTAAALYETFAPAEARRVLRRVEFHYVPKHASWLNMVEIAIGVLVAQCLDRRIPDRGTLSREVSAWTRRRNDARAAITWMFGIAQARATLGRAYPTQAAAADATAA